MDNFEEKLEKILDKKLKTFGDSLEKNFDAKIDNLALSVQKEFSKIHEKLNEHTEKFLEIDNKFLEIDTKINTTKLELLDKLGSKEKIENHELRIQNIEEKVFQA